ncbi:hypothetical protein CCACVL1_26996 [Corchorus capsularis]|uniref:Uncharacterized protein n=1 Tax=Corchorus capsularis TaxID=210143 RepID=A0A1R3GCI7_COCAP|nr:hypothetical protein CCACVL1_26996 [Corchorus capsularis]
MAYRPAPFTVSFFLFFQSKLPRKDSVAVDQSSSGEAHPVLKVKKVVQASEAPTAGQTQKPSLLSMPMQMLFYQKPHVSKQFGGHNPQIQSQCVKWTSIAAATLHTRSSEECKYFLPEFQRPGVDKAYKIIVHRQRGGEEIRCRLEEADRQDFRVGVQGLILELGEPFRVSWEFRHGDLRWLTGQFLALGLKL